MSDTTAEPLGTSTPDATPAPSIEDTMSAAYDRAMADDNQGDGETAPEGEQAAPSSDEAPQEGQPRAPDGKFASKDQTAPAEPTQPVAPTVPDYLAPYVPEFQKRGIPVELGVRNLMDTWQRLETNPELTLTWLAQQYGFVVSRPGAQQQATPQAAQPEQEEWVDPAVANLRRELDEIKARDAAREAQAQQMQQAAYMQAYSTVQSEVTSFAESKAKADGIDFNALRPTMAALISSGQAETLEDAYDKAVWANPTTRAAKIEADRKQSEAAAAAENAAKAAAARRAGQINVRTDVATPARGRTIEETMSRVYDDVASRA